MPILDYIVMKVFTRGIIFAGLSFFRTGKNMKSFFAAGSAGTSGNKTDNSFSLRVIGIGVALTGLIICILGLLSQGLPKTASVSMDSLLPAMGFMIFFRGKRKKTVGSCLSVITKQKERTGNAPS